MDKTTNIEELKEQIKKFCDDRDWDQFHGAKELAIGISTEASEILEHFRFKSEKEIEDFFDDTEKKKQIGEEMADTLFLLLRMSQRYNVDLSDALIEKIKKNEQNYPIEKAKGSNKKYTEF